LQALHVGCSSDDPDSGTASPIRPRNEPPAPLRPLPPDAQVRGNIEVTFQELRDHLQLPRAEEWINNNHPQFTDSQESELPYARDSSCEESSDDEEDGYNDGSDIDLEDLLRPPPELRHNPRWLPRRRPCKRATPNLNDQLSSKKRGQDEGDSEAGVAGQNDDMGEEGLRGADRHMHVRQEECGACGEGGTWDGEGGTWDGGACLQGTHWPQFVQEPHLWAAGGWGHADDLEGEGDGVIPPPPPHSK
jgi:hypothetical protein